MDDLNNLSIIGRLTDDIKIEYTKNNAAIGKFDLAVNVRKQENGGYVNAPNFFKVRFIGKGAEALKPYLTKGKRVGIEGSIRQDKWEWGGKNYDLVYILAKNVQLLEYSSSQKSMGENEYAPLPDDEKIPF